MLLFLHSSVLWVYRRKIIRRLKNYTLHPIVNKQSIILESLIKTNIIIIIKKKKNTKVMVVSDHVQRESFLSYCAVNAFVNLYTRRKRKFYEILDSRDAFPNYLYKKKI